MVDPLKLPPDSQRTCPSCGAPLADNQRWCLQCGAGAPGSVARERDWRPLALLAAVAVIVLAGAATAAALALNQHAGKPPTHLVIAEVAPPVTSTTPPTGSGLGGTTGAGSAGGAAATLPGAGKGTSTLGKGAATGLPSSTVRPPKLPSVVPTPHPLRIPTVPTVPRSTTNPTSTGTPTSSGTTPTGTTPTSSTPTGSTPTSSTPQQTPNPILLDTDAASVYNPSGYPTSYFGDPALAIDGETSTAWTVQVEPKIAPLMAAGLALDLNTPTRVGSLEVITTTPGMTVEVFGSNAGAPPETITDPAWTKLAPTHVVKKKKGLIKLGSKPKAYRFLVLWLIKAPASAIGTPTAPGHVSISEVVPYPPAAR
jgi:hypothetical protein